MADFPVKLRLVSKNTEHALLSVSDGFEFSIPADIIPSDISNGEHFSFPLGALAQHLDPETGLGLINGSILHLD